MFKCLFLFEKPVNLQVKGHKKRRNLNMKYQFFNSKITFVNSHHAQTTLKGYIEQKNGFSA